MIGSIAGCSDLNIVYTSRCFQPCAETFDDRYQFVGPSIAPRSGPGPFPWEQLNHPVIVYISLGTLFNADAAFYRRCFDAFRNQDVQVVMSVGANVSVESLSPVPPNFIVQPHVPQLEVLERAAAFVTHGGMNSVSESLFYGVPVVVIPQMSEQEIVARRVEQLGAGICLTKAEATSDTLRESVRRLLADEGFRRQAAPVRESFQTAGSVVRAADAIRAFVASARRPA